MKRIFLITLTLIFSFMQATHAMSFDSLWNKIKEHHMAIAATLGGIVTVSAFIGYKKFQKNAAEKKALEDFKKAHTVNIMFYLGNGTRYSTLKTWPEKKEYLAQHLADKTGKKLLQKKYFLDKEELQFPFRARQKEELLLGLPLNNAQNQHAENDNDHDLAVAIQNSLYDRHTPPPNFDGFDPEEMEAARKESLKKNLYTGLNGKEEE